MTNSFIKNGRRAAAFAVTAILVRTDQKLFTSATGTNSQKLVASGTTSEQKIVVPATIIEPQTDVPVTTNGQSEISPVKMIHIDQLVHPPARTPGPSQPPLPLVGVEET